LHFKKKFEKKNRAPGFIFFLSNFKNFCLEKVIRLLFAKLNGVAKDKKSPGPLPDLQTSPKPENNRIGSSKSVLSEIELMKKQEQENQPKNPIFITQEG